jgi:hypothetical protein
MTTTNEGPGRAAGAMTGPDCSLLGSENVPLNSRPTPPAQAAILDLHREFIAECLRVAAVKASHGADNILLGDDLNAERDIRISVENIREAAKAFRELRALNEAVHAPSREVTR